MVYQIISLAGAVLILAAFAAQQQGWLAAETFAYQALNFLGGICLCIAAIAARQYGFILLDGAWTRLSGWGLMRVFRSLS